MDMGRIITAMVTPFDENLNVDFKRAVELANHLVDTGTDTVLIAGTTGETPTLTHDEEFELFDLINKAVKGRAKVMAGTGSNSTRTAVSSSIEAEKLGVDFLLQVVPYYNKPCQEGLYYHFSEVAKAVSIPILLYNIPGRTGINMEPETVARLANEFPTIAGIKETTSVEQVASIRALTPDTFSIYSGDDSNTLPFMEAGGYGVVSVASHCAGSMIREMVMHQVEGRFDEARALEAKLMPLFDVLFITANPIPTKAALAMQGLSVGGLRPPLLEANESQKAQISRVLNDLGLLN